ncbi:MAG: hypothetical protein F6K19_06455 [Cyanothece sp. SIO1E1]|nr:hypothetical protein [Cyanothece sp. SIO1E1]
MPLKTKETSMQEFEAYYRETVDDILNQLQTVSLLAAQVEAKTVEIGNSIQTLRQSVRTVMAEQKF